MKKEINLFISQPMSGLSGDEIQKERDRIVDNYCLQFGYNRDDIVVVNQIEYEELRSDEKHGPLTFLGLAIQRLAIADVVIFHKDWQESRGCVIEHEIVSRYCKDYKWMLFYDCGEYVLEYLDKLTEELYNQLGIHTDKLEPKSATKISNEEWHKWAGFKEVEDGYYRQVDKAIKEQTLSDLYPTMRCATGSCAGCNELYIHDGKACLGDVLKYTCKKKNITILSDITPKPENFVKVFKEVDDETLSSSGEGSSEAT